MVFMRSFDRQRGTLIGLVVRDAIGAAVEFEMPGSFPEVTGCCGGGPHGLASDAPPHATYDPSRRPRAKTAPKKTDKVQPEIYERVRMFPTRQTKAQCWLNDQPKVRLDGKFWIGASRTDEGETVVAISGFSA